MNEFFRIRTGIKNTDTVYISPKNGYYNQDDINRILGINTPFLDENIFTKKMGKKFYDIVKFMDAGNFAISEKLKLLLESNIITGWDCFSIEIEGHEDKEYFAFQLSSKNAGKILNLEKLNNYEEDFIKFNKSTWDGSDLFTLDNTAVLVCTARVKELLEKEKITNIEFTPIIALGEELN